MRIAIYYEDYRRIGRNDGAPLYVWNVLKNQLGHDVEHLIPKQDWLQGHGKFDLHVWVDWGEDALLKAKVIDYEPIKCPGPSVYWVSDSHLGYEYRLNKAREFDHVFCMQKRACDEFSRDGIKNPVWLPHAVEPKAYPKKVMVKNFDVCFIGHVNCDKRISFLDRMYREFPNFYHGQALFEKAASKFGQSRIVLNSSIKDDLNMRVFESMATGSFLLTDAVPTLGELFKDGVHLATYKDFDEAVDKAKYYLAHEDERENIAKRGMEEVLSRHTYRHRIEAMLKTVKERQEQLTVN